MGRQGLKLKEDRQDRLFNQRFGTSVRADTMSKPYLFLYNAVQAGGWSYLLMTAICHLVTSGLEGLYHATAPIL